MKGKTEIKMREGSEGRGGRFGWEGRENKGGAN